MSQIEIYNTDNLGELPPAEDFVLYSDYKSLQKEVEQLREWIENTLKHYPPITREQMKKGRELLNQSK